MAEIEITTAGELKLAGDTVGHIAWVRPFIESDVAGVYDDEEPYAPDWHIGCTPCDEKEELLSDIEDVVRRKLKHLIEDVRKEALTEDGVLVSSIDAIEAVLADLEFETRPQPTSHQIRSRRLRTSPKSMCAA